MNQLQIPLPSFQIPVSGSHTLIIHHRCQAVQSINLIGPRAPVPVKPSHFLSLRVTLHLPPSGLDRQVG